MEGVILITGASGRIGRRAAEFLAHDAQRIRLMTRDPGRAPKSFAAILPTRPLSIRLLQVSERLW